MKIVEALKKVKDLRVKAVNLREKITLCSAHMENNPPEYKDPKVQIKEWLQIHKDIIQEIESLLVRIQVTNTQTQVMIEIGGNQIVKSIAAWVYRERELSELDFQAWSALTDRGLRATIDRAQKDPEKQAVKVIFNFDAAERDKMTEIYRNEKSLINSQLEITNAVTDLL